MDVIDELMDRHYAARFARGFPGFSGDAARPCATLVPPQVGGLGERLCRYSVIGRVPSRAVRKPELIDMPVVGT